MPRQTWIADAARSVGLAVIEVDGWRERGKESFNPGGVVFHHTAGASTGEMPSLRVLIHGRSDVPGPLCNWGLSRSGVVYVVAAGRSNNAGKGSWRGMVGNSSVLGIEAENDGRQPWPARQLDAYYELCAAAERHLRRGVEFQCGHKEWAPGRKVDPHSLDMEIFRAAIRFELDGVKEEDMYVLHPDGGVWHIVGERRVRIDSGRRWTSLHKRGAMAVPVPAEDELWTLFPVAPEVGEGVSQVVAAAVSEIVSRLKGRR